MVPHIYSQDVIFQSPQNSPNRVEWLVIGMLLLSNHRVFNYTVHEQRGLPNIIVLQHNVFVHWPVFRISVCIVQACVWSAVSLNQAWQWQLWCVWRRVGHKVLSDASTSYRRGGAGGGRSVSFSCQSVVGTFTALQMDYCVQPQGWAIGKTQYRINHKT